MENNCKTTPRPKTVKEFFKSWYFWRPFLGVVIGGGAGLLYFFLVGCQTGTCPITGSPIGTTITGSIFGLILTSSPCARSKC
jgi:hypothetical protein